MGGRFSGLLNSERKLELDNEPIKLQCIMSETKFKFSLINILGRSLILEVILTSNFRIAFVFFFCLFVTYIKKKTFLKTHRFSAPNGGVLCLRGGGPSWHILILTNTTINNLAQIERHILVTKLEKVPQSLHVSITRPNPLFLWIKDGLYHLESPIIDIQLCLFLFFQRRQT